MAKDSSEKLRLQLSEFEDYIPQMNTEKADISKASAGWHISHSLKVVINVIEALKHSNPENFRKSFNLKRFIVLMTGKIPRGKAKSPTAVLPDADLTPEILLKQISSAREKIAEFAELPKDAFFKHPFFDHLSRDPTKKFLVIHTEHHLKIIRDILRK